MKQTAIAPILCATLCGCLCGTCLPCTAEAEPHATTTVYQVRGAEENDGVALFYDAISGRWYDSNGEDYVPVQQTSFTTHYYGTPYRIEASDTGYTVLDEAGTVDADLSAAIDDMMQSAASCVAFEYLDDADYPFPTSIPVSFRFDPKYFAVSAYLFDDIWVSYVNHETADMAATEVDADGNCVTTANYLLYGKPYTAAGDLNLDAACSISDAILSARFVAEDAQLTLPALSAVLADANSDSVVDAQDTNFLLHKIAGLSA